MTAVRNGICLIFLAISRLETMALTKKNAKHLRATERAIKEFSYPCNDSSQQYDICRATLLKPDVCCA